MRKQIDVTSWSPVVAQLHCWSPEMQKAADAADISMLFFSAGANFWAILGHFGAILAILGHFGAILGNFWSFLGYLGSFGVIFGPI